MKSPNIIIVGGVAGGASAAAKARRVNEHAEITIFKKGPYVSFANCGLPYMWEADAEGFEAFESVIHPLDHADYYPGGEPLHLKLVVEAGRGR